MEVGLRREGHEVIALGGAEAARAWTAEAPPTLIVAASDLPGDDGLALLEELRDRPGWEDTPSLVLTPERTPEVVARGMELGAQEFLTRPVFVRELLARVRMVLERRSRDEGGGQASGRSGPLEELSLVDLLTGLEAEAASGVVYLESGERKGRLFLRDGRVVDAKVGGNDGADAALRVFRWQGGSWTFDPRPVSQRDRIGQATTDLLAEALERAQAWAELWDKLPGDDPVLEVDFQGVAAAGGQLPPDAGRILRLFDGVRSAGRVVEDSPFDDLATLKATVRLLEQGLLSAPEATAQSDDDEPTRQLDAWLDDDDDDDDDDEDRTPTGAMGAPPTVVVVSPDVAAAEAAARARAAEIIQEAEEARAAAEHARKEAEAAREAAEQARAVAEGAVGPATAPPPPTAPAAPAESPMSDVEIERDPSDEIPGDEPDEDLGSVLVIDDDDDDDERKPSMLPELDASLLDGAGPPPEEEDSWGDVQATIAPEAPPLGDEGDEVRLDTSAIIEEESLDVEPAAPAEEAAGPAEVDWAAEAAFGDDDDDDDVAWGAGQAAQSAPKPPEDPLADALAFAEADVAAMDPDDEPWAEDVPPAKEGEGEGDPESADESGADAPGVDPLADPGAEIDDLLGDDADDGGEFDWSAELDEDETVPSTTPPPPAPEDVEAVKGELEDFGWGDTDEEAADDDGDDGDLDWGDALEGAGGDEDDWSQGGDDGDTDAEAAAFGMGTADHDALPPPASPPTAVDVDAVKVGVRDEAADWEQALAEGDEFYEDEAPPPLAESDSLDFDIGDDSLDSLDFDDEAPEQEDPDPDPERADSGPIDLSQFASKAHKQVKGESGGSIWLKVGAALILLLAGILGGGFVYLDAQRPPPPLDTPGGAAKPRPPRVDDPNYPLGMKTPKSIKKAVAAAKPLPPPVDEAGKDPLEAGAATGAQAADDAPPVPVDIAKEATGAAALVQMSAVDSVAAQVASRKQGVALPPDKASRKLHKKHFKRAEKLRKKGKNEAAVAEYTQAMAHRPGHVPTLLGLGNAYFDLGQSADARGVLAQAVKADPSNGKAWLVFGMVLQEEGEKPGSIKAYRQFLELRPEDKYAPEVQSILKRLETE